MDRDLSPAERELQLKDWLNLVEFGTKTQDLSASRGKIIDELPIFNRHGGKDTLGPVRRLVHIDDMRFFNLGPVYTHCGVPMDIIGEFRGAMEAARTPYEGPRLVLNFRTPIFSGLGEWGQILEGLQCGKSFEDFKKFMCTQRIRQKDTGTYWTFEAQDIIIRDPMACDRREWKAEAADDQALVTVFLPVGNKYGLKVDRAFQTPVGFVRTQPRPEVITEAQAMLSQV